MNKLFEFCQKINRLIADSHIIVCGEWLCRRGFIARKFVTDGVGCWVFGESLYVVADVSDVWIYDINNGEYVQNVLVEEWAGTARDKRVPYPSGNNPSEVNMPEEPQTRNQATCCRQPPATAAECLEFVVSAESIHSGVKGADVPRSRQDDFFWQAHQLVVQRCVQEELERKFVRML